MELRSRCAAAGRRRCVPLGRGLLCAAASIDRLVAGAGCWFRYPEMRGIGFGIKGEDFQGYEMINGEGADPFDFWMTDQYAIHWMENKVRTRTLFIRKSRTHSLTPFLHVSLLPLPFSS